MLNVQRKGLDSARAVIQLADGTVINVDESRIMSDGLTIEDVSSESESFNIGFTSAKVLTLSLLNYDEHYSTYNFNGAVVIPYIINNKAEYKRGLYTVQTPKYAGGMLSLTCYDNVYKLEKDMDADCLKLPCTYAEALKAATDNCGITLGTLEFDNSDMLINELDKSITTYRQLAGYIMQCAGSVLKANDEGILIICDYKRVFQKDDNLDGGHLDNYMTGDNADGGNFTDYNSGYTFDGGTFGDRKDITIKYDISDLTAATDDTVITGIAVKIDDVTYMTGESGYVLDISGNPLITEDNVKTVLDVLVRKYAGLRFRKLSGKIRSDFRLESMDPVCVEDYKGNSYDCYMTRVTYTIRDKTSISCDCKSDESNKNTGNSTVTKLLKMADSSADRKVQIERGLREKLQKELSEKIAKSSGFYTTQQKSETGGYVYYTHDKPTLEESTFITKWTAEAIALSMDGGKTYPYGFTMTAKMIMDAIAANKIAADYIGGGTLVLGGEDNTQGVLQILDSSGAVIGSWDEAGLNAKKGKIGNLEITEDGFKADDNERIFLQVIDGGVKIYAAPREGEPSKGSFIRITKYGVQIESYGEIDFTCIGAGTMNLTGDIYVNGKELKV